MIDRLVMLCLFLLLSGESFLASYLGGKVAAALITLVIAALAYGTLVFRLPLSPVYRFGLAQVVGRARAAPVHAVLFLVFAFLLCWSLVRATQIGTMAIQVSAVLLVRWVSVLVLLVTIVIQGMREGQENHLLRSITAAFLVYCAVNVAFYFLGVQNTTVNEQYISSGEHGLMFGLFGLSVLRAPVPAGGGINTGGLQSAAGIAMGLVMIWRARQLGLSRLRGVVLAMTSAFLVLLTDSRGGMMAALIAVLLVVVIPGRMRGQLKWLALAIPLLPLMALLVLQWLGTESWASSLSRTRGTSSVDLLSGRPFIWASVLSFLSDFQLSHLVGYGAIGQVGSKVSSMYSSLFATMYANPEYAGAHNALLQAVLDVGYLGALVQLALFWSLFRALGRAAGANESQRAWSEIALAILLCLMFLGVGGETLNTQAPNTLVLFLAVNIHVLTAPVPEDASVPVLRAPPNLGVTS